VSALKSGRSPAEMIAGMRSAALTAPIRAWLESQARQMVANGVAPERSYFRLAVIRAARDSLLLRAEIRRLPSTTTA
jgi:hypothetical protein